MKRLISSKVFLIPLCAVVLAVTLFEVLLLCINDSGDGTFVQISTNDVTIEDTNGVFRAFNITDRTRITYADGDDMRFDELRPGMKIEYTFVKLLNMRYCSTITVVDAEKGFKDIQNGKFRGTVDFGNENWIRIDVDSSIWGSEKIFIDYSLYDVEDEGERGGYDDIANTGATVEFEIENGRVEQYETPFVTGIVRVQVPYSEEEINVSFDANITSVDGMTANVVINRKEDNNIISSRYAGYVYTLKLDENTKIIDEYGNDFTVEQLNEKWLVKNNLRVRVTVENGHYTLRANGMVRGNITLVLYS